MQPVARAVGALLVIGTLFVPYAQPVLCAAEAPAAQAHGQHGGHAPHSAANLLGSPGHGVTCHGAPACGVSHVAPIRGPVAILSAPQHTDRAPIAPVSGSSAILTVTAPPPKV